MVIFFDISWERLEILIDVLQTDIDRQHTTNHFTLTVPQDNRMRSPIRRVYAQNYGISICKARLIEMNKLMREDLNTKISKNSFFSFESDTTRNNFCDVLITQV